MKIYCLRFDHFGKGDTLVMNSACIDRRAAKDFLADRLANCDAFRDEYVAVMREEDYTRENHGYKPFAGRF